MSRFKVTPGSPNLVNRRVLFSTVRGRTSYGFRSVWLTGDGILDVCLCVAAAHHRPHKNLQ